MGQGPVIPSGAPQQPTVDPPVVSIKDVKVSRVDDRNANVEVAFSVKNPNKTTLVLETIHYEVHVDNVRMTIGDVGQSPEGFLASQSDIFTIVSGTTLTVSDEQTAVRTTMSAGAWDTMVGGGATYTVDTVRTLRSGTWRDASLVMIMGSDQFERFDTWREWEAIADLAHLAVARRGGAVARLNAKLEAFARTRQVGPAELAHRPAGGVVEFPMTPVDASATEARRLLADPSPEAGRRLARLLPTAVLDYIRAHRLYS